MKKLTSILSVFLLASPLLLAISPSHAEEIAGIKFPSSIKQADKSLVLNGLGLREATIFSVDVYVAALYLENKSKDPGKILSSPEDKRLDMRFVRNVSRAKIESAWVDGLKANASNFNQVRPQLKKLNSLMSDMKDGETLSMLFRAEEVEVVKNGKSLGTVSGKTFPGELLSIWLGKSPPNESLKKGLLGLK